MECHIGVTAGDGLSEERFEWREGCAMWLWGRTFQAEGTLSIETLRQERAWCVLRTRSEWLQLKEGEGGLEMEKRGPDLMGHWLSE